MIIVVPSCLKDADGSRTRSDQFICVSLPSHFKIDVWTKKSLPLHDLKFDLWHLVHLHNQELNMGLALSNLIVQPLHLPARVHLCASLRYRTLIYHAPQIRHGWWKKSNRVNEVLSIGSSVRRPLLTRAEFSCFDRVGGSGNCSGN